MSVLIEIDRNSDTPIYRQIIEQVVLKIQEGHWLPGDKLPTERELAKELSIARGTINKAYAELERTHVIETNQGRGTFVSEQQNVLAEGRRDKAVGLIDAAVDQLEGLKFSHREINTLFQIVLMERAKRFESVHIAAIDCNPESLSIFERHLRPSSPAKISMFVLDEVKGQARPEETFGRFDLILVTASHFPEVLGMLPNLKDRIVKVALSVSQQTVISLARIPVSSRLGIVCRSKEFLKIIRSQLKAFQISSSQIRQARDDGDFDLSSFLVDLDILIVPPDSPVLTGSDTQAAIQYFQRHGGRIVEFDYQIDRGTIIHIGERISRLLETR